MRLDGRFAGGWTPWILAGTAVSACAIAACGGNDTVSFTSGDTTNSTGTTTHSGGTTDTGGSANTGGSTNSGGTAGSGGHGTGGATGGGGSTTTTSGPCNPGDVMPCYDGPDGTKGVGPCKAGTAKCKADGTGFEACMNEVLPGVEDCAAPADEDCNGEAPACSGSSVWAKRFGGPGIEFGPYDVAVDGSNDVLLAGGLQDGIDFGGGAISTTSPDAFVAKFDPSGNYLWHKRWGADKVDSASGVVADSNGNIHVTGQFDGAVDFGGGTLTGAGANDVFVVELDKDGNHVWSKRFGDADYQYGDHLAVDSNGSTILCGHFHGNIDLGGGTLSSGAGGVSSVYVAKLDASGGHVWSRALKNSGNVSCGGVGADAAGNVFVAGGFDNDLDIGGGTVLPVSMSGAPDIYVLKISAGGGVVWSKTFGDAQSQSARALAVSGAGDVFLSGRLGGTADFGNGLTLISAGGDDVFVAKLTNAGTVAWAKQFGDAAGQVGTRIAVDALGSPIVVGQFQGSVNFGGSALTSAGSNDAFVAKFDANGGHLWSYKFGAAQADVGEGVAADSAASVLVTGEFAGSVDFGGGALNASGTNDIFLLKRAP